MHKLGAILNSREVVRKTGAMKWIQIIVGILALIEAVPWAVGYWLNKYVFEQSFINEHPDKYLQLLIACFLVSWLGVRSERFFGWVVIFAELTLYTMAFNEYVALGLVAFRLFNRASAWPATLFATLFTAYTLFDGYHAPAVDAEAAARLLFQWKLIITMIILLISRNKKPTVLDAFGTFEGFDEPKSSKSSESSSSMDKDDYWYRDMGKADDWFKNKKDSAEVNKKEKVEEEEMLEEEESIDDNRGPDVDKGMF